LIKYR